MSSLGNFNASLNSFRAEQTNALVNVNLELNVFKNLVTPPSEYAGVGKHLAPLRQKEAEEGVRHKVARKLGILFKDKEGLPSTPELIKAYGTRASEIAKSLAGNPQAQGTKSHGAFASMIGADATTLWAAATSGRPAIQCHLLACLLARIWEAPEATSLWVEVVNKRREELKTKFAEEGTLDTDVLLVIGDEFQRSDFQDWDASVRAWLRVADSVMKKQQTQLRLILDNAHISVNEKPTAYDSVIDAWASAMKQMELLLKGTPLQVHRGDILLGLLSWHLYPDMNHLAADEKRISGNDHLLENRGLLTLGLEPSPRMAKDYQSVYWALPLSHLRYYGRLPVTRTRSVRMTDKDRISVSELLWVMLSAYIAPWNDRSLPAMEVLEYFVKVAIEMHWALGYESGTEEDLGDADQAPLAGVRADNGSLSGTTSRWKHDGAPPRAKSWLTMFVQTVERFKDSMEQERAWKLLNLGYKTRCGFGQPFGGVFSLETFLVAARTFRDKVDVLRKIAKSLRGTLGENSNYEFIIMFKDRIFREDQFSTPQANGQSTPVKTKSVLAATHIEGFATALPEFDVNESGMDSTSERKHQTWLFFPESRKHPFEDIRVCHQYAKHGENVRHNATLPVFKVHRKQRDDRRGEGLPDEDRADLRIKYGSVDSNVKGYDVWIGNMDTIALLGRSRRRTVVTVDEKKQTRSVRKTDSLRPYQMTISEIMEFFQPERVDFQQCAGLMKPGKDNVAALLGLSFIESLYSNLAPASVDVRIIQTGLQSAMWIKNMLKRKSADLDFRKKVARLDLGDAQLSDCFACIAMMETGTYNLNPTGLTDVFAMCCVDSLYIASALLHDPYETVLSQSVERFTGNIGKAGIAFLVPPKAPEIRSYNTVDEWYQCTHAAFDGQMEDCFGGTSLHLSFSEASQAINVEFSGGRDIEAYFLEALISVYDRETWIAEVDILGSLRSSRIDRDRVNSKACDCEPSPARHLNVVSIDNYAELLIPTDQPGIVRAKHNWQARLVVAALCVARGYRVILKSEKTCLDCAFRPRAGAEMMIQASGKPGEPVVIL